MEEIKIYQQIDWNGFHIGTNADLVPGAIDIEAPIYDSLTHKANFTVWITAGDEIYNQWSYRYAGSYQPTGTNVATEMLAIGRWY